MHNDGQKGWSLDRRIPLADVSAGLTDYVRHLSQGKAILLFRGKARCDA